MKRYVKSSVCVVDGRADSRIRKPFDKISQREGDGIPRLYSAHIADARLKEFSFESFGYYNISADSLDEIFDAIDELGISPYAYNSQFKNRVYTENDSTSNISDRQVELYWDGRGTKITRGEYTVNNMTEYTSL